MSVDVAALLKPAFRSLLRIVLLGLVTLALVEIVIRFFDPLGISDLHHQRTLWRRLVRFDVPRVGKCMRPNANLELGSWSVTTNSFGFRDEDLSETKPPGEKRLLLLGDSYVFGHGVPQDKIAASLLEDKMRDETGHFWQVINTGLGSYATHEQRAICEAYAQRLDVDAVMLVYCFNDALARFVTLSPVQDLPDYLPQDLVQPRQEPRFRIPLPLYPRVLDALTWLRKSRRQAPHRQEFDEHQWAWRLSTDNLLRIKRHCDDSGVPFVIAYLNHYESSSPASVHMRVSDALKRACAAYGIPFHDLREPSRELDLSGHRNSRVDGHPDADGHEILARMLFDVLRAELLRSPAEM